MFVLIPLLVGLVKRLFFKKPAPETS